MEDIIKKIYSHEDQEEFRDNCIKLLINNDIFRLEDWRRLRIFFSDTIKSKYVHSKYPDRLISDLDEVLDLEVPMKVAPPWQTYFNGKDEVTDCNPWEARKNRICK
jgi:hypothetical protein